MIYFYTKTTPKKLDKNDDLDKICPLYDIRYDAIVYVNKKDIDYHIINNHLRPPINSVIKSTTRYKDSIKKVNVDNIIKLISKNVQNQITYCKKPSFVYLMRSDKDQHTPYYTKKEMYSVALNNGLIDKDKQINTLKLCKILQANQFQKMNIFNHANYIQKSLGMYIIRYYTFVGDAFMNSYLRDLNKDEYINNALINNIKLLWKLINNAPAFSKKFIVYRRIGHDFLSHLKIGDIYKNNSFMSTTRDPVYEPEGFTFGNIVLKINIPKNKKGGAIMTELYSHFPQELEVLIPPNVDLKLINKNWKYYHHNKSNEKQVKITYEFDLIKVNAIEIPRDRLPVSIKPPSLNLAAINLTAPTLQGKIQTFLKKYTNNNLQFSTFIGPKEYLFYVYFYDSTTTYKDLYKYKTDKGISIIHQNKTNGQICLFLELGPVMHVNYHVHYYDIDNCPKFTGLNKFDRDDSNHYLSFLQAVASAFRIDKIVIHPNKMSCAHFYKNSKERNLYTQYLYRNITYDKDLYNLLVYHSNRFIGISAIKNHTYDTSIALLKQKIPQSMHNMNSYKKFKKQYPDQTDLWQYYIYIIQYESIKLKKYENLISKILNKNVFNNMYVLDSREKLI
tara:strand:- start:924 stop:2774 length:1851 start_codon:yes stop_codon:yes gene_type:complete